MPSEAQQLEEKLEQPWKKWHADLNPMGIEAVREGTLILNQKRGDGRAQVSGNHGTTALKKKYVDLSAPKEKPTI
jgi:hypothetical protein